jgi:outer membrane protein assembly factor BamA
MHQLLWKAILITGFLCLIEVSFGQTVTVQSITVYGLKKTKPSIVSRELTFSIGDSLVQKDLGPTLERNSNNLLNLGIFNEAVVNISEWDTKQNTIDIVVTVQESWYIYALPIFDLADRNFNVWWTTHKASIKRINIGARLDWVNFTGRNDKLKALMQFGYTPKQELEYRFPYFNKNQSLGLSTGFLHSINKEISFATTDNLEEFVRFDERVIYERWEGRIGAFYRPNIFVKYDLGLGYQYRTVDNRIVTDYNPDYFIKGDSTQSVFTLGFAFEYDDRDVKIFPARGVKAGINLEKIGLGISGDEDILNANIVLEWNIPVGRRFQHRISALGKYSVIRTQPSYIYYRGLGSGVKYVSGYELYAIDGLDAVLGKYQLAYKLLERKTELGNLMPIPQFRTVPYAFYVSLLAEVGYVNDPYTGTQKPLANRILYGGGPAVSVLIYNNFFFQFSYAGNHLGEWGLFIHSRTSF